MKRMTNFFQQLAGGRLANLSKFKSAVAQERVVGDAQGQAFERFLGVHTDALADRSPARLVMPSLMTAEPTLRQHNRADWQHTDPRLRLWAAKFIEAARRRGIPLYVHSAFRTKAEQQALLVQGVSKAKWPRAPHCQGMAVDIVHSRYHWDMTKEEWAFLAKLGRDVLFRYNQTLKVESRLHLEWGGSWTFYDPAHWEVRGWSDNVQKLTPGEPTRLTPRGILALS